jgi:cytochrome P450
VNRICAPVQQSISRKVVKPFEIDGYSFKKGTVLTLGYRSTMNNVKYWDDPSEFSPERFQHSIEYPNSYTPFATGPRNCIGQHMALM